MLAHLSWRVALQRWLPSMWRGRWALGSVQPQMLKETVTESLLDLGSLFRSPYGLLHMKSRKISTHLNGQRFLTGWLAFSTECLLSLVVLKFHWGTNAKLFGLCTSTSTLPMFFTPVTEAGAVLFQFVFMAMRAEGPREQISWMWVGKHHLAFLTTRFTSATVQSM